MSSEPLYHCLTQEEWINVTTICTYAETKVLYYLLAENPMGDRTVDCRVRTLAERLKLNIGTVSRAIKALEQKGLIGEVTIQHATFQVKPRIISQKAQEYLAKKGKTENNNFVHEVVAYTQHNTICTQQAPPTDNTTRSVDNTDIYKERARAQTLSDISNPPDRSGGGGKNAYEQPERTESNLASLASKPEESTRQVKASSEDKSSGGACNDLLQVLDSLGVLWKAQALLNKMEELEIKPCQGYSAERIAGVIKECDLSQLWGALRHIEETWESIRNPTAIFCSKAPKMPVEAEHRLPEFDRAAHDEKMAQATTPEASKAEIEKIKREKIKAIASSSGDKKLRKFADLIPSMPSIDSKPNTDFDTDYAAEQRRLARQMMEEADGDASS